MQSSIDIFSLEGRRVLVTGSSRGIGRAIATGMAGFGAHVAFHGSQNSPELESAVNDAGKMARGLVADIGTLSGVDQLADLALDALGGIDILVLNASIEIREPWHSISHEAFIRQVSVNLESSVKLIGRLTPGMVEQKWGRVLAIGSVQEVKESPAMLIYAGLKAAQTSMMRNLARQLAAHGVTCNTLAPGVVETDRNRNALADQAHRSRLLGQIPMESFGAVDDCVGAAVFLCSAAGRYVTGTRLLVDGGMHL